MKSLGNRLRWRGVRVCVVCPAGDGTSWYRPTMLSQLQKIKSAFPSAKLLCGNTAAGVYGPDDKSKVFVDISGIAELRGDVAFVSSSESGTRTPALRLPATTTLTELSRALTAYGEKSASFVEIVRHLKMVASWQVGGHPVLAAFGCG